MYFGSTVECCYNADNIVRYYINEYRNRGRISIRVLDPQDTPYLVLTGKLWDVFCEYLICEKIGRVITALHCMYRQISNIRRTLVSN